MKSKVQAASWLGIMTVFSWILNYMTYPILMRYLSLEQYAEISVLQSIFTIISIPLSWFGLLMLVEFRQNFLKIQKNQEKLFKKNLRLTLYYIIFLIFALVISYFVFAVSSIEALILLFLVSIFSVFSAFYYALFQATEKFLFLGCINFLAALIRLSLAFLVAIFPLVWIGFLPFTIPSLICVAIYVFLWKKILDNPPEYITSKQDIFMQDNNSLWLYTFVAGFIVAAQTVDILLIRKLFDNMSVAIYASVAIIVKFALVFIAVLETVSLPALVDKKLNSIHKKYIYNLILISILGIFVSIFMLPYAGNWVLEIIKDELLASHWVWIFLGVAIVSLGFFSIFIKVLIAWKRKIWQIFLLPALWSFGFFFVKNLEEFSFVLMCIFLCLYIWSVVKILKK